MEPVTLDPADYWKLKALMGDLRAARERAAQMLKVAAEAHDAHAKVLATKYPGLVLDEAPYRLDDATCTLTRQG